MAKNNSTIAAARKLAFNQIAGAALNASGSNRALRLVLAQAGIKAVPENATKSVKDQQQAIRRQFIYGYMAAGLDGQTDADRIEHARALVEDHAGYINPADYAKGGKLAGKELPGLPKGAKGRRTAEQEKLYTKARVALTRTLADMDIKTLSKQGGDRKKSGAQPSGTKPNDIPPAEAKTPSVKELREAAPKYKDALEVHAHLDRQAATLMAFINKNAAIASPQDKSAVQDFIAALKGTRNDK